jgi:hypothetical protein
MRSSALATVALLVGLGLTGCSSDPAQTASATAASGAPTAAPLPWTRLPDPPLSPRVAAIAVGLEDRLLVVGGEDGPPCPPNADCAAAPDPRRDGASYDPATRNWTPVAAAPVGVLSQDPHVVAGDLLFILTADGLISYDPAEDSWTRHPAPEGDHRDLRLVALGDQPAAVAGERRTDSPPDEVYDPDAEDWVPLPADPLGPSFDRVFTDTPTGAVLTAKQSVPDPGSAEPAVVRAALLSTDLTTWQKLPDSDIIGGYRWAWTGKRLVDPTLGEADGGQIDNWGRSLPYGGTFDPESATWGRLPGAPAAYSGGWMVEALGGPVSASGGWLYDDRTESWSELSPPAGAPQLPGAAVWVGDDLFVVGGQYEDRPGQQGLAGGAWVLTVDPGD